MFYRNSLDAHRFRRPNETENDSILNKCLCAIGRRGAYDQPIFQSMLCPSPMLKRRSAIHQAAS